MSADELHVLYWHETINCCVPHSARLWDYWMGGKDYYRADQEAGDRYAALFPGIIDAVRHVRYFTARAVRFLIGEAGVRQLLNVGTGFPCAENVHEVAQRAAPGARVVYVDNDPLVMAYACALLTSSTPEGAVDCVDIDVRDTRGLIKAAEKTLNFVEPIGLLLTGLLGYITDDTDAYLTVRDLMEALPPGSYLVAADLTCTDASLEEAERDYVATGADPYRLRTPEQVERFFDGLDMLSPGVQPCSKWRPDPEPFTGSAESVLYGGAGRKPAGRL
jgi:O-methyltransferase involved in polyketide biosynthesis